MMDIKFGIKKITMRLLSKIYLLASLSILALLPMSAAQAFVVQDIKVEGLQGISRDTVISYLPVQVGEQFNSRQSANVIRTLYGTGFFSDVSVGQQGNVLVIHVTERPVLASINVSGNKTIPKDKLNDVLKSLGLVQGRVFDNSVLQRIKHSLETEYDNVGKYNAIIDTVVTPEPRNRVAVKIDISEGRTAQVTDIRFVGNKAFSDSKLRDQLTLTKPHFWSFLTRGDLYSEDKLNASLDALRNYYMDRGYLKFTVDSAQATLTPDRQHVYLIIKVTEGPIYKVKGYAINGNLILSKTKLANLINIKTGSTFSRKAVKDASDAINKALGDMGYAFANVNVVPDVDDANKEVFLTFFIEPGNRVYVHRINFSGNTKTEDVVLRHSVHQMEGGLVSTSEIKESERLLNLTGYLTDVHVDTLPVPDAPDQVDLNYKVTEGPSAQAIAGVGYGTDGFVVNAGVNQNNFLGTGRTVGVNFQNSLYSTLYSIDYNNPYYTIDGIQRGFSLYAQKTTPGNLNITTFTQDSYGGVLNYNIPISARGDYLLLGAGYQDTILRLGSTPADQVVNFTNRYGRHFSQVLLNTGWSRNGLDRAIMPTQGLYQSMNLNIGLPGGSKPLSYYKLSYTANFYQPIAAGFIFMSRANLGYGAGLGGTDGLPFFANYYAGGIGYSGQVRGFETNSLGPKDTFNNGATIGNDSLGGNKMATGTAAIIFPNPLSADKLRTSVFVDAGNVYSSLSTARGGTGSGPIRMSTGLGIDWQVPVLNLLLSVSYAKPLNAQPGDQVEHFQFNIGTNF
jgi:outer membrane protein insertion porin family